METNGEAVSKPTTTRRTNSRVKTTAATTQTNKTALTKKSNLKPGLENEVLGTWSVRLRNLCGTLSVVTTNIICLMGMFTVHKGVTSGGAWPHWIIVFLVVSGPVLVSFSFMNVTKLIQTILKGTEKAADVKKRFISKLDK